MSNPFNWPTDSEGNPLILVNARVQETIPTVPYGNVEIDLTLTGFGKSFSEAENIEESLEIAYDKADSVLQKKRDEIIKELDK